MGTHTTIDAAEIYGELADHLFRTHFENQPIPAYIWQREGGEFRLVAHNRAGAEVESIQVDSLLGTKALDLFRDQPECARNLHRCADQGAVIQEERDLRTLDGVMIRVVMTYVPLTANAVVIHSQDVGELHAKALELEQSETRMRALLDADPDVIFRMDSEARMLDYHVPVGVCFPWESDEIIGKTVGEIHGEDVHRQHVKHHREAIRTGQPQVFDYQVGSGDALRHLECRVARAGDDEVIVNVRDVSERVELETKLTMLAERLRNRVGHEIHDGLAQTLTGARMMIEHLQNQLNDQQSPLAGEASRAAELINLTIEQARELVRGLSPIPTGMKLFDALRLLAKDGQRYLGVECRTSLRGDASHLDGDEIANVYRIAQEAITNAARHGHARLVEIVCDAEQHRLDISISDDGTGLPQEYENAEGLGLRIMRYRARAIGGQIRFDRRKEGGTVVSVRCVKSTHARRATA